MFSLTMPLAMLVLFSQVFRSVAESPSFPQGVSYIDFLTPAMLAVSTVMAGTNAGVAAAVDHTTGLSERFAALPMATLGTDSGTHPHRGRVHHSLVSPSSASAPSPSDSSSTEMPSTSSPRSTVLVVLAAAMSAFFGVIGDRLRRPDVVQFAGMMIMMPFMFVSSAFAPLETMPNWMRTVADINPVSHATDAVRAHVLGHGSASTTATALIVAMLWGAGALTLSAR